MVRQRVAYLALMLLGMLELGYGLAQSIRPVLRTGEAAPRSGGGRFKTFGQIAINESGVIVFNSLIEDGTTKGGIYLLDKGQPRPVVVEGDSVPGIENARFVGSKNPLITNRGSVLFWGRYRGLENSHTGLFLFSQGKLATVALQNRTVSEDGILLRGISSFDINDAEEVVFSASIFTEALGNSSGIFRWGGGRLETVALPSERPDANRLFRPTSPSINDDGRIFFLDRVVVNPTGYARPNRVLTIADGALSVVDLAGIVGYEPTEISVSRINASGRMAVATAHPERAAWSVVLIRGSEEPVEVFAAEPMRISEVWEPLLNDSGDIAFMARANPTGGGPARVGLFVYDKTTSSAKSVAVQGNPVLRFSDARITRLRDADINDKGQIALIGELGGKMGERDYAIFISEF